MPIRPLSACLLAAAALAAVEAGGTVQVVKPNEFHIDVASSSSSGTTTITDEFGFQTESDYESDGTRLAIGFLATVSPDEQPVALLAGLDLVFSGYASSDMGVDTTMASFGINGALGLRLGASDSPVFLDLLGQLGLGVTALDVTSTTMTGTGSLMRMVIGGSIRPGVWLDSQQSFGLYGLLGVESTMESGTVTFTVSGMDSSVDYQLDASATYVGLGFCGKF